MHISFFNADTCLGLTIKYGPRRRAPRGSLQISKQNPLIIRKKAAVHFQKARALKPWESKRRGKKGYNNSIKQHAIEKYKLETAPFFTSCDCDPVTTCLTATPSHALGAHYTAGAKTERLSTERNKRQHLSRKGGIYAIEEKRNKGKENGEGGVRRKVPKGRRRFRTMTSKAIELAQAASKSIPDARRQRHAHAHGHHSKCRPNPQNRKKNYKAFAMTHRDTDSHTTRHYTNYSPIIFQLHISTPTLAWVSSFTHTHSIINRHRITHHFAYISRSPVKTKE